MKKSRATLSEALLPQLLCQGNRVSTQVSRFHVNGWHVLQNIQGRDALTALGPIHVFVSLSVSEQRIENMAAQKCFPPGIHEDCADCAAGNWVVDLFAFYN